MKRFILLVFISLSLLALTSCSSNSTSNRYGAIPANADPIEKSVPLEIAGTIEGIEGSTGDSSGLKISDLESSLNTEIPHYVPMDCN